MYLEIIKAIQTTCLIVLFTGVNVTILGIITGIVITITAPNNLMPKSWIHILLKSIINLLTSIPSILQAIILIPILQNYVPNNQQMLWSVMLITIICTPFLALQLHNIIRDLSTDSIEIAQALGADYIQSISKIMLPNAWPSISKQLLRIWLDITTFTIAIGCLGFGGLGQLAYQYGFIQLNWQAFLITFGIILMMFKFIQILGKIIINSEAYN